MAPPVHLTPDATINLIFGPIMVLLALFGLWQGRGHIVNHFNGTYPGAASMRNGDEEERIELDTRSSTVSSTSEAEASDEDRSENDVGD